MKLKHLWLKNFCQHADKQVELSNGLMGILGPNGSGKSNLINGIIYAITGTLPNNLSQYIKQGSEGGSFVQLTFQSDLTGMTYVIKRSLQPRRAELTCVETSQTIRKAKDIDAFLIDTLKIDFNIVKNVLTVSQEDFVSFFRATPSARAEILTRLFGFLELKTAREALRQILVSTKDNSENAAKLKAYRELLAETERSLEPYKNIESSEAIKAKINDNIAQYSKLADLSNLYATVAFFDNQKALYEKEIAEAEGKIQALGTVTDIEQITSSVKKQQDIVSGITSAVQQANEIYKAAEEAFDAQKYYLEAYTELQKLPNTSLTEETLQEGERKYNSLTERKEELERCRDIGKCPTCGQPFADLEDKLTEITKEWEELQPKWFAERQAYYDYKIAKEAMDGHKKIYSDRYERLKKQAAAWLPYDQAKETTELLAEVPPITKSLEWWLYLLKGQIENLVESLKFEQKRLENLEWSSGPAIQNKKTYDMLQYSINLYRKKIEEIEANAPVIPEGSVPAGQIQILLEESKKESEELTRRREEAQRAEQIRDQIKDITLKIEKLESLVKQDEEKLHYREVVSEVCETLSPDAFPKYVMIGLLEMLTSNINYYLSTFNSPFTVRIDNSSTELYCEFSNGETFLASELSGGQKMILAISWRLALHNTFATEESCGFLTLDEPTNHLDENNIQNLTQVMAQVKQAARDKNLQVLVITHEKALEPLFDAVIRL